ncbi:LrgB family protein [Cohnella nanjingensis]|uniref:LrgB family protein n=1 Tax=Cohnella nanjingensis TaxID=1387779 RepID=A0A7X0VG82_9BACL|nr:LrgB family protein [Cohnella nanjingensis]MBB6671379.1 LrgB family protein [Cohnella nanjingensis]
MTALFWLAVTVAIYAASKLLYRRWPKVYLTPLVVTPAILIAALAYAGVPYGSYDAGAGWLSDLVEPATIALAVTLYKHTDALKRNIRAIVWGVGCGAVAAIVTSAGLARLMGLTTDIVDSLAPRSATTPIAVSVSGAIGGLPTITAVATMITGLTGMVLGPLVVRWFGIRSPAARGILFGTSAHSAGISKAFEYDAEAGSVAGIAMLCTAFVTLCAAPWLMMGFRP